MQERPPQGDLREQEYFSLFPTAYNSSTRQCIPEQLGRMNIPCQFCSALHWLQKRVSTSSRQNLRFENYCKQGAIVLEAPQNVPELFSTLFRADDPLSKHFRDNIRQYNSALAFTSLKYTPDPRLPVGGVQNFQIHGELYHMQKHINAELHDNDSPHYAQLYLYDPTFAVEQRITRNPQLNPALLRQLTEVLHDCNPFINIYKTAAERIQSLTTNTTEEIRVLLNPQMKLLLEMGADRRRSNLPTVDEVAIIIPDEYNQGGFRDIVLAYRNPEIDTNQYHTISSNSAAYMPLHYVLFFPCGDLGWHWALTLQDPEGRRKNLRITQRAFYRYMLHFRQTVPSLLFYGKRLFQQYLVDAWAACDQNKCDWIRSHQKNLRADLYNGLADALVQADTEPLNPANLGKRILPSSFVGGDRWMMQLYQDSMAIVRFFGRPTLFLTFTANPKWEEIVRELLPGQKAVDRPDLIARVFQLKKKEMLRLIKSENIFGRFRGDVYTIEYQKRGLPHMHLLIFLHSADQFLEASQIDEVICAELPTAETDPNGELTRIVTSVMLHGPCGDVNPHSPCMSSARDDPPKCTKRYPRNFLEETSIQENGYPLYRRRDNGSTHEISHPQDRNRKFTMDNCWVVPYNLYLTRHFGAHINVEVCSSVQAIKYIHKYIYKGSDRATIQVDLEKDEVAQYLQGRYIGPTEAMWRIFEFSTHEESPSIEQLAIHLPGEQPVYFKEDAIAEELQERMNEAQSTLMAFFDYNDANDKSRRYLY